MTEPSSPAPSALVGAANVGQTRLSDADYQGLTAAVLAKIEAIADQWLQDDIIDVDTQRTGGLLELSFPNGSKLIVNTQPPLQEICASSRASRRVISTASVSETSIVKSTRDASKIFGK